MVEPLGGGALLEEVGPYGHALGLPHLAPLSPTSSALRFQAEELTHLLTAVQKLRLLWQTVYPPMAKKRNVPSLDLIFFRHL